MIGYARMQYIVLDGLNCAYINAQVKSIHFRYYDTIFVIVIFSLPPGKAQPPHPILCKTVWENT